MKLLHIIDSLGRGGAETLLVNTIRDLPQYQHIICYLGAAEDFLNECKHFGNVYNLHFEKKTDFVAARKRLKKIIINEKVDLIHSHLMTSTILARCSHGKIPLISTVHSILSEDSFKKSKISLFIEKLSYSSKDFTIFVSQSAKNDYNQHINNLNFKRSIVLHNYVDDVFLRGQYRSTYIKNKPLKIVAVGNLKNAKNYASIISAFIHLKSLPIHLDIYGEGDLRDELQQIIDENQLNVRLMGRSSDIIKVLDNYDAYLMGSLYEGCPIAPMEAMCFGMPLILSDIGPLREIAEDKAVYFDPHNPEDIAKQIRNTYENWDSFIELSAGNKEWASARYSKENYLNKLTGLYTQILNKDN